MAKDEEKVSWLSKEMQEQYPNLQEVFEQKLELKDIEWRLSAGEKDDEGSKNGQSMINCYITARTFYKMLMKAFSGKATHGYFIDDKLGVVRAEISYPIVLTNGETHIVRVPDQAPWEPNKAGSTPEIQKKAGVSNAFKRIGPHLFEGCMWLYEMPKSYMMKEGWKAPEPGKKAEKLYWNDPSKACFMKIAELMQDGKLTSDDELIVVQKSNGTAQLCYKAYGKPQEVIWTAPKGKATMYAAPKGQEPKDEKSYVSSQDASTDDYVAPKEEQRIYTKCKLTIGDKSAEMTCIDCRNAVQAKVGADAMIAYKKANGAESKLKMYGNGIFVAYVLSGAIYLFDAQDATTFAVLSKWKFSVVEGIVEPS